MRIIKTFEQLPIINFFHSMFGVGRSMLDVHLCSDFRCSSCSAPNKPNEPNKPNKPKKICPHSK